jgi:signal transduction histidine kinase
MAIADEVDEQLVNIAKKATEELKQNKEVNFPPFVEIEQTDGVNGGDGFEDIDIDVGKDELEPYRQLTTYITIGGKNYKTVVRISMMEKQEMLIDLSALTIIAILFMVLIFFLINSRGSKNLFKDFYTTLDKLENFSLKDGKKLSLDKSYIVEFEALNKSLQFLSERAVSEYRSLKEFTEEVNHEIQTPIAVIKTKIELLLQNGNLAEHNLQQITVMLQNLHKIEKINKSMLLLNKLENKHLFDDESVSLNTILQNVIETNEEFKESKNLTIETEIKSDTELIINAQLLDILLQNLVSNAIKHNIDGGKISVYAESGNLAFTNTSLQLKSTPERFFNRFYKESDSPESAGLGLTIVKKICELYGFGIKNGFEDGNYSISISFTQKR